MYTKDGYYYNIQGTCVCCMYFSLQNNFLYIPFYRSVLKWVWPRWPWHDRPFYLLSSDITVMQCDILENLPWWCQQLLQMSWQVSYYLWQSGLPHHLFFDTTLYTRAINNTRAIKILRSFTLKCTMYMYTCNRDTMMSWWCHIMWSVYVMYVVLSCACAHSVYNSLLCCGAG